LARRLRREGETSPFVVFRERGSAFTTAGFAAVSRHFVALSGARIKHPCWWQLSASIAKASKSK
jgi:hypothetical protein